jgi:hypothetical protein
MPLSRVRIASRALAILVVAIGVLYILHRTEQFLIRDPRFSLNGQEGAPETPAIEIRGAAHASPRAIQAVFSDDSGRSVYLLPLEERRRALLGIDWVRDAAVSRLWPDRLEVRIVVTNRGDRPAAPLEVTGELFGERRAGRLAGGVPPGGEGAVHLDFDPSPARPGLHALTLLLEYPLEGLPDGAGNSPVASERAWLLLALGGPDPGMAP